MSYQTVSDIFAGSQNNYDFQKKDFSNGVLSSGTGSSTSFGELVSFYKNENQTDVRAFSNSSDVNYNSSAKSDIVQDEKTETDKTAVSYDDEKVESDSISGKAAEKTDNEPDTVSDAENKEKSVSDADEKKQENSKSENDLKAGDLSENDSVSKAKNKSNSDFNLNAGLNAVHAEKENSGKNLSTKDSKNGKISKLTDKDFARMHEISGHSDSSEDSDIKNIKNKKAHSNKTGKVPSHNEKSDKIADNKIAAEELAEKMQKEAALEEASKNAGAQNQIASVSRNNEDKENLKLTDEDSELSAVSENGKAKGQVFMDKDKKISVEDLRTTVAEQLDNEEGQDSKSKFKVSEPKLVNENTANITMEMKQNVNANVLSSNGQTAAANGSNFQAMLNNQIQQSAPEFVKAGNLVLKDNNQGTINLLLRPDELGNVKLHLSLDGKNITGHITVATREALEVFKDNAETLREAFIKSGFESASFDVAYSGNNGAGQENTFQQQNDGKEFVARKVYENHSENADGEFDKIIEKNDKNKEYSINIVA